MMRFPFVRSQKPLPTRQSPRITVMSETQVIFDDAATASPTTLLNISAGGALLLSSSPYYVGVSLGITLSEPIFPAAATVQGRVLYNIIATKEALQERGLQLTLPEGTWYLIGLQFIALPDALRQPLQTFIDANLRDERKRRRQSGKGRGKVSTAQDRLSDHYDTEVSPWIYAVALLAVAFEAWAAFAWHITPAWIPPLLSVTLAAWWLLGRYFARGSERATLLALKRLYTPEAVASLADADSALDSPMEILASDASTDVNALQQEVA